MKTVKLFILTFVLVGMCAETVDAGLFRRGRGWQRPVRAKMTCTNGVCRLR